MDRRIRTWPSEGLERGGAFRQRCSGVLHVVFVFLGFALIVGSTAPGFDASREDVSEYLVLLRECTRVQLKRSFLEDLRLESAARFNLLLRSEERAGTVVCGSLLGSLA